MFKYLNKRVSTLLGVAIIVLVTILVGGTLVWQYWWLPKEEIKPPEVKPSEAVKDEAADWKTYRNEKYGYVVRYPPNWRIAYSIMALKVDIFDYYETMEDWVMFTNLFKGEEKKYLEALESYQGTGSPFTYVENANGRSVMIAPVITPMEVIRKAMKEGGREVSDFKKENTKTGLEVFQMREIIKGEIKKDFELSYILYPKEKTLWDEKVKYILLEIERNEGNYEKEVYDEMLSTFQFLE